MATLDAQEARGIGLSIAFSIVAVGVFAWFVGVSLSWAQMTVGVVIVSSLGVFLRTSGDVSVGFVVISLAMFLAVVDYLVPTSITDAFGPFIGAVETFFGVDLGSLNTIRLLIVAAVFVALYLVLYYRFVEGRKGIDKIADRVNRRFSMYFDTYANIARAMALLAVGLIVVLLKTSGQMLGEIGNVIAEVPLIASNFGVAILGYLALGGEIVILSDIPFLGDLTATGFAFVAIIIVSAAAAAEYQGRGALSQYLKRLVN